LTTEFVIRGASLSSLDSESNREQIFHNIINPLAHVENEMKVPTDHYLPSRDLSEVWDASMELTLETGEGSVPCSTEVTAVQYNTPVCST
jgi:hypothetical protein